jgi:hypothetical protein
MCSAARRALTASPRRIPSKTCARFVRARLCRCAPGAGRAGPGRRRPWSRRRSVTRRERMVRRGRACAARDVGGRRDPAHDRPRLGAHEKHDRGPGQTVGPAPPPAPIVRGESRPAEPGPVVIMTPPIAPPRPPAPSIRPPVLQPRGCCMFLIGDAKPWRQCDAPIERRSYCIEHARLCFVRVHAPSP